ncbi:hypothetical protein P9112_004726 [Eukaryota sp. TZLM1-RC]
MKVLLAVDAFKECLDSYSIGSALATGLQKTSKAIFCNVLNIADGGCGTLNTLHASIPNSYISTISVQHPTGAFKHNADVLFVEQGHCVIECAQAVGLSTISPCDRNPVELTSFGLGEVINYAIHQGSTRIDITLGGSGTNDAGVGLLEALGARFFDIDNKPIEQVKPQDFNRIDRVDVSSALNKVANIQLIVASDVTNPLYGQFGATRVYGPQKGVTEIQLLEESIVHFSNLCPDGPSIAKQEGTGAAGGLGFALKLLGAKYVSGADFVLDLINFQSLLDGVDLVITGEGCLDYQTSFGKAPAAIAARSKECNVPVIAVAGSLGKDFASVPNIDAFFSIQQGPCSLEYSVTNVENLLVSLGQQIGNCLKVGSLLTNKL